MIGKTERRFLRPEKRAGMIEEYLSQQTTKSSRRKLTGAKQWIVVFFALLLAAAVYAGLYPWGFFLGGSFHPLGYWAGWGQMHSIKSGDYYLFVRIWPSTRALETIIPHTFVRGQAYLCTPGGERFFLKLSGSMRPHIYLNTLGEPIGFHVYSWRAALPVGQQSRPSFLINGRWGKGEITGDDDKTLSQSFSPDGKLIPQGSHAPASQQEDIQITLREGSYSEWESACSQVPR